MDYANTFGQNIETAEGMKAQNRQNLDELNRQTEQKIQDRNGNYVENTANITTGDITVEDTYQQQNQGEQQRYGEKMRLYFLMQEYTQYINDDPDMNRLCKATLDYINNQNTEKKNYNYSKELKQLKTINDQLQQCQNKLDEEALDGEHDTLTNHIKQRFVRSFTIQIDNLINGNPELALPDMDDRDPTAYYVDGTDPYFRPKADVRYTQKETGALGKEYKTEVHLKEDNGEIILKDASDQPLFPHEPSANDIAQGALGDCFFIASLSEIAESRPDKIKEAMHDNGNGTVTVRFFNREKADDGDVFKPVYVTVDKVLPQDADGSEVYSKDCLWVQTMERAYAASGLQAFKDDAYNSLLRARDSADTYQRPVPENLKQVYEWYRDNNQVPDRNDYPWLVDDNGNLKPYEPNYLHIKGGKSFYAMQVLLGPECEQKFFSMRKEMDIYSQVERDENNQITRIVQNCSTIRNHLDDDYLGYEAYFNMSRNEAHQYSQQPKVKLNFDDISRGVFALYKELYQDSRTVDELGSIYENAMQYIYRYQRMRDENDPGFPAMENSQETRDRIRDASQFRKVIEGYKTFLSVPMRKYPGNGELRADANPILQQKFAEALNDLNQKYTEPEDQRLFQRIHDRYLNRTLQLNTYLGKGEPYSGTYSGFEKDVLRQLQSKKTDKNLIICSTDARTDSSFGLRTNHAYTFMDTVQRKVNGKDLWFVRLRNPHAKNTMKYKVKNGTMKPVEDTNGHNGYFDIELGDFARQFSDISISKPLEALSYNKNFKPVEPLTTEQKNAAEQYRNQAKSILNYDQVLENIQKELKTTHSSISKDSDAFKNMETAVIDARRELTGINNRGESIKINLQEIMQKVSNAAQTYLNHTLADPRIGGRRAERVQLANSLQALYQCAKDRVPSPVDKLREDVAERMMQTGEKKLRTQQTKETRRILGILQTPNGRRVEKDALLNSKEFAKICGRNFTRLNNVMRSSEKEITKVSAKMPPVKAPIAKEAADVK